jgi:hypothetical protein
MFHLYLLENGGFDRASGKQHLKKFQNQQSWALQIFPPVP